VVLAVEVALLRLVYPIAIVLVEQAWAGSALVLATLSIGLSAVRGLTADRVTRLVRAKAFDTLTAAIEAYPPLAPLGAPPIEQLESEIAKGVPWIEAMVVVTLPDIAGNAMALPIIAWMSWVRVGTQATLIASAALLGGAVLGGLVGQRVQQLGTVAWDCYQPVAHMIERGFRGRVELGIHLRSQAHRASLLTAIEHWSAAERRLFVWGSLAGRLVPAVTVLLALGFAALAGHRPLALLHRVMSEPSRSAVAASLLALTTVPIFVALVRGITDWFSELPRLEALARFVGFAQRQTPSLGVPVTARAALGSILVENVSFTYPNRRPGEPPTVVGASFAWGAQEALAICGANGSGKTTLTWLVMGIIAPNAGNITVEMGDARHPPSALSGRIAYLPQQPYFGELQSVGEAIRFIAPDATDAEIERLVSELLEDHFVGSVRTLLDRRIMSLSVGERRVIALARVLLRRSEFVILDEPEANLDEALRARVLGALRRAKSQCRMLIVTHDEAFAAVADRVYRMPSKHSSKH